MYHYSDNPPKGYTAYESSPNSSYENHIYYAPQQHHGNTPTRRHSRKTSWTAANPYKVPGGWHSPAGYPSDQFYEAFPSFTSPPHKGDVSGTKNRKSKMRSYTVSGGRGSGNAPRTQKQFIYVDDTADAYDSPRYEYREPKTSRRYSKPSADQYFYFRQEPAQYEEPKRTRTRRASTNTRSPQKATKNAHARPAVKATEADATRAGIPAGYSIKNWDPTESPIVLLGSVFDANSLGKWIYDWTVYHHGASTPMADVAGDLWLLLIKLAGKMKRAEECVRRIRNLDSRDMVEDFLESGTRLWQKFKELLKECERYMWKAAKREGGKGVLMGKNAGIEFVESIFGRDRKLETTEKLMNNVRLWNMRFDANCEDILRRPSAS